MLANGEIKHIIMIDDQIHDLMMILPNSIPTERFEYLKIFVSFLPFLIGNWST